MIGGVDRRSVLQARADVLGIDFVHVDDATQTLLEVHFIRPPDVTEQGAITKDDISIVSTAGDAAPIDVTVSKFITLPGPGGALVLQVQTAVPGGFSRYTLRIAPASKAAVFDPYLSSIDFSFKAACPSDLDCDHATPACTPDTQIDFPVDYQARDFWSLRTALLDFASQRYPGWADRLEADAAVMLTEVMSALGDELAYYQDRVGREAHFETATQRRSLRRHARMVDYDIHDGLGASTWINVTAKSTGVLLAGTALYAVRDGQRISYSVGKDLAEILLPAAYGVATARNADQLEPYQWDVHDACLAVGTTRLSLFGDVSAALLPFDDVPKDRAPGRWMLLTTDPESPSLPARRHLIRVITVSVVLDPLSGSDTTLITWELAQALTHELDLRVLHVHGNLIPALAGARLDQEFVIGPGNGQLPGPEEKPPWAIERRGPNASVAYLFSLARTDTEGLVRRASAAAPDDPRQATPELQLIELVPDGAKAFKAGERWSWRPSFLGAPSSEALDRDFILDDGTWQRVVGYRRSGGEFIHMDYASNTGVTIRFGDGVFGRIPPRGTRFVASYLVGNGRRGNLPAGAITNFDQATPVQTAAVSAIIAAIDNPFAVDNGLDPETPEVIRQLAPEAFRQLTYRAVRPEDYAEAAERLPWVQRGGCRFRWTGSWQTAFVTPDPRGGTEFTASQRSELEAQLDRFRQAGRETHALSPRYADLDLEIRFCVAPDAYPAEVKVRVLAALTGSANAFFAADNFTFGTPLERPRLEATIQNVSGVKAVEAINFRRRGYFDWRPFSNLAFTPAVNEVIRVDNDLLHPDRGSIQLTAEGA